MGEGETKVSLGAAREEPSCGETSMQGGKCLVCAEGQRWAPRPKVDGKGQGSR